ncbi:response regulator receiver protein [Rhodopseudomonas palustris TIE-1]|uniref:winged helix-turn-helix domain-containing protein n=1 Tax=Rhodopseudomonas palustris TaxID=1076 RepID=UPI00017795DA|nr:winged helix-turn-helix domain-containing protein [Rhodopseudomonas palustris]ACE99215.1 response regulator receiver protein [Rhodopseudomonas palustris TIE-1]
MSEVVSKAYHEATVRTLHQQIETMQDTIIDLRRKLLPQKPRFPTQWKLSPHQDRMLAALVDNAPNAVSHERMMIAACGRTGGDILPNTLTMHVSLLRRKLLSLGFGRIESHWNVGYFLRDDHAAAIKLEAARVLGSSREMAS